MLVCRAAWSQIRSRLPPPFQLLTIETRRYKRKYKEMSRLEARLQLHVAVLNEERGRAICGVFLENP